MRSIILAALLTLGGCITVSVEKAPPPPDTPSVPPPATLQDALGVPADQPVFVPAEAVVEPPPPVAPAEKPKAAAPKKASAPKAPVAKPEPKAEEPEVLPPLTRGKQIEIGPDGQKK